jgi:predicted permease
LVFTLLFALSILLHISVGRMIFHRKRLPVRHLITHPIFIGTSLGFIVHALPWSIPTPVFHGLQMLADLTMPLMLFALGARMASIHLRQWHRNWWAALLAPAASLWSVWLIVPLASLWTHLSPADMGMLYLFGSLPPAIINFLLAEEANCQPDQVASIVVLGHLISLFFIPLALLFAVSYS